MSTKPTAMSPVVNHRLVNLIKRKKKALLEHLKCVYSESIKLCVSNQNCITSLDYLENKINSLFNQSQERKQKEGGEMPRGSCIISFTWNETM